MISNDEKHQNYVILKVKLKKALQCEFWFEACMIEYVIMEDRMSSILGHGNVWKDPYDEKHSMNQKIKSIKAQIEQKHKILSKKLTTDLFDRIYDWKEMRNTYVHRACTTKYDNEEVQMLANDGKKLVDLLCNAADRVKNAALKNTK